MSASSSRAALISLGDYKGYRKLLQGQCKGSLCAEHAMDWGLFVKAYNILIIHQEILMRYLLQLKL